MRPSNSWTAALAALCAAGLALANVEKAIFLAPAAQPVPQNSPTLSDLHIDILTHTKGSLRTHLAAAFPSENAEAGAATWLLLDELNPGQRYEVRVCWAATQPTAFTIDTYELPAVFGDFELLSSLSNYSTFHFAGQTPGRYKMSRSHRDGADGQTGPRKASVMLLRILAAADYFTDDAALMIDVPPVYVDIILDPYLLGAVPASLALVIVYILIVAVTSWPIAKFIAARIEGVARGQYADEKKRQ